MSKKFTFINADGFPEESLAYETSDYLDSSSGAADAGKPIKLDAEGKIDASMIDDGDISHLNISDKGNNSHADIDNHISDGSIHFTEGSIDHGNLDAASLLDDDHTQYSLADGSRDYSGKVSYSTHPTFVDDKELIDKKYADDLVASAVSGLEWQDSVITDTVLDPSSLSPSSGERWLINGVGAGAWAGKDNQIAEYNGSGWDYTVPTTGMHVSSDDQSSVVKYYGGSSWVDKSWEQTTASTGLLKSGYDIQIAPGAAGSGIAFNAGVLSVNATNGCEVVGDDVVLDLLSGGGLKLTGTEVGVEPNDFAGEGLVDDGSDNMAVDWSTAFNDAKAVKAEDLASVVNGKGASIIGLEDSAGNTSETNVEGAIAELYGLTDRYKGVTYTVGTGGVSIGDLVYPSDDDTVLPYSNLSNSHRGIGLALSSETASSEVIVAANDTVVSNVLSGATAGTPYYWNGSSLVSTIPSGSGSHVWQAGVAKNDSDLHVEVRFVKKNA